MAKLKLSAVRNVGEDTEYVFLQALEDVDIGDYILTDTTYRADGTTSNKLRHVFEFQTKMVKKGEYVALYSKPGTNNVGTTVTNSVPVHRIFWGLKETIWNDTGDRAHLFYAPKVSRQSMVVPAAE